MSDKASFHVHSPLIVSEPLSRAFGHEVLLKVDVVQPSGSFKIRGIGRTCQEAIDQGKTHLVSSSGGNAGNAVAYAGQQLGVKVTVVVPSSTAPSVRERIRSFGANVIVHGDVWADADKHARQLANSEECAYVHPFDQESTWEGHTTIVDELVKDMKQKPGLIVVSVGGGGLLLGITRGLDKAGWSDVPILAMETEGADALNASVKAGSLVTLDGITSLAKTLGASTVAEAAYKATTTHTIYSAVVSDRQCVEALCNFADDQRLLVEPACAAAISPLYFPAVAKDAGVDVQELNGPVVAIVCGGSGVTFKQIQDWRKQVGLAPL